MKQAYRIAAVLILLIGFGHQMLAQDTLYWLGAVSNEWSDVDNWSDSPSGTALTILPGTSTTAIIPSGTSFDCVLDMNVSIASLELESGANFDVGSYNLELSGDLKQFGGVFYGRSSSITIGGFLLIVNGTFNSTSGTLEIGEGVYEQNYGSFNCGTGTVRTSTETDFDMVSFLYNLVVPTGSEVTLNGHIAILNNLELDGIINTNLKALYIDNTSDNAISGNGGIYMEVDEDFGMIIWHIAEETGTYSFPVLSDIDGDVIPFVVNIDEPGEGEDGRLLHFNLALPPSKPQVLFEGFSYNTEYGADNSTRNTNRIRGLLINDFDVSPEVTLTVNYLDEELTGIEVTENDLVGQAFIEGVWQPAATSVANPSGNAVTISGIEGDPDMAQFWSLVDGNSINYNLNVLYWTGADDNDWSNGLNWAWEPCGNPADTIPDSTMTVVFLPCDSPNVQAMLSSNATVKNVTYAGGYDYLVSEGSYTLTVLDKVVLDGADIELTSNWSVGTDIVFLSGSLLLDDKSLSITGDLTVNDGILDLEEGALSVTADIVLKGGQLDCGTATLDAQQKLKLMGGAFDGEDADLEVTGNMELLYGSFVSSSGTLTLGAAFQDPNGLFQANNGKVLMESSSEISTRATLYDLSVASSYTVSLAQELNIGHILELDGSVSLEGNDLKLASSSTGALQNDGGKIIAEGDAFAGKVYWAIGTSTGTYTIPFTNAYAEDLTVEVDVNTAGTGAGSLVASIYPTDSDIEPLPAGLPPLYEPDETPEYELIVKRFWLVDFEGYTSNPDADLLIKYVDRDYDALSLDPADLKIQEWFEYGWGGQVGSVNTTSKTLSLGSFKGGVMVANGLLDVLYPYRHDDYATLKRKLDGSYYVANDGLNVKYDEAYNAGNLNYAVYDQSHTLIFGSSLGYNIAKSYGDNRFFLRCHCYTGIFTSGEFYVLEVTNEKGEKFMLRFKYNYLRPCIQIGGVGFGPINGN